MKEKKQGRKVVEQEVLSPSLELVYLALVKDGGALLDENVTLS